MKNNNQNVKIGFGVISELENILDNYNPNSILLIHGQTSYVNSGAQSAIFEYIEKYSVNYFSEFSVNPKYEDVIKGTKIFNVNRCDLIISIGGGSAIDMGKCINVFQANGDNFKKIVLKGEIKEKGVPLIAIPTTTGTGSEATHFSVIYLNKIKYSIASKLFLPTDVLIDPEFSLSQSKYQIACSGMDAFCQSIESYWAVNSTNLSKKFSMKSLILCKKNIYNVVSNKSRDYIYNMALAAFYSGKAINISKTTASHALSYPISHLLKIPHGHSVALTIAQVFNFNYNISSESLNDKRGKRYVKNTLFDLLNILDFKDIDSAILYFNKLLLDLGLYNNKNKKKIISNFDLIMLEMNLDRLNNNPRSLKKRDLLEILNNI